MKVSIVKKPTLLAQSIVNVLQDGLGKCQVSLYSTLKAEIKDNLADLLIINLDVEENILPVIRHYQNRNRKVAIVTYATEKNKLLELFKLGLDAYFYNEMEKDEIVAAVRMVLKGKRYIHPILASVLLEEYVQYHNVKHNRPVNLLTQREWEVLELMTKGYTNEKISEELFISDKTVVNHVSAIFKKLSVPNRMSAAIKAVKERWV